MLRVALASILFPGKGSKTQLPFSPFYTRTPVLSFMIDREQVQKVAHLARLQLTAEEEEKFTTQLNDILNYFEQLSELDVSDVLPTTRAIDVSNVVRPDHHQTYAEREALLNNAPDRDGEFFKVPKIVTGE